VSVGKDENQALASEVLERTEELARIPAPTGAEAARAALVAQWWSADGWNDVGIDDVGNVRAGVRGSDGDAIVLCAHLDTVFAEDVPHEPRTEGARLYGPSVGDDAIGVAALSAIGRLVTDTEGPAVWIVATVGEEGLGNLRGIRAVLESPPAPVRAVLAIEGNYLGRVSARGVGSIRWRVRARGPGGHAWERADAPSAVHEVASIAVALSQLRSDGARTSVNIGRIGGGEAINARAQEAWLDVDIRADDPAALDELEARATSIFEATRPEHLKVHVERLGRRPSGALDSSHELVAAAMQALRDVGVQPQLVATSTDANAAHEAGIPAVALGVTSGEGEHTLDEWIDTTQIPDGLAALAGTVTRLGVQS
jgi:tripeptide aminopeptidase